MKTVVHTALYRNNCISYTNSQMIRMQNDLKANDSNKTKGPKYEVWYVYSIYPATLKSI
jgi:hypothetical protein